MRILLLAHSYPLAPQTFTQAEVEVWRDEGLSVTPLSFRRPPKSRSNLLSPHWLAESERTLYLASAGWSTWLRGASVFALRPGEALRTLLKVATTGYARRNSVWLRLHSVLTWLRAIGAAGVLRRGGYQHLHAEFANDAATVAWILHRVTGVSYSFRDHFSYNPQLIWEKVSKASTVVACCEANRSALLSAAPDSPPDKVVCSYLGVDVERLAPVPDGGEGMACVGTLQEKKGQIELVHACAMLRERGVLAHCRLVGGGPLRGRLEALISRLNLEDRVTISGYVTQEVARRIIERSNLVCLPSVVTDEGDVDGIPVALMEAMALGRPCVSTDAGGIAELIRSDVDGILVPQRDIAALADALERVLADRNLRLRLGAAARRTVEDRFRLDVNARESARLVARAAQRGRCDGWDRVRP